MARGLPRPDHIGKIRGGVIEDIDAQPLIVCAGQKGIARTQAGAHDAELGISLLGKPVEATADVNDRLACSVNGSSHVGADSIVGAGDLRRSADIVIRRAHAQC